MAPNPNGVVDETVAVISLRRKDDSEVAKIWNYACHPVSHPTPDIYSSHFIGKVRSYQREQCGNIGLPIIFFQGFSGAARPSASVGASLNLKSLLLRLFDGPTFRQMPKIRYENWSIR
jgi:hypothetical protein